MAQTTGILGSGQWSFPCLERREAGETHTAPRTTGKVVVSDELVGFAQAADLLSAEQVELYCESRRTMEGASGTVSCGRY
jgi:hypothetical protein